MKNKIIKNSFVDGVVSFLWIVIVFFALLIILIAVSPIISPMLGRSGLGETFGLAVLFLPLFVLFLLVPSAFIAGAIRKKFGKKSQEILGDN